jgi:hypothetical protein
VHREVKTIGILGKWEMAKVTEGVLFCNFWLMNSYMIC